MNKVLVLEESTVLARQVAEMIENRTWLCPVVARSLEEAGSLLASGAGEFIAGVASLFFPGAPDAESIRLLQRHGVPAIAMSSNFDAKTRTTALENNALAYVLKRPECLEQIVLLLERLASSQGRGVLIVDDSPTARERNAHALSKLKLRVMEAGNGAEALQVLERHPGIVLVVTDYHMPELDGVRFVSEIRRRWAVDKLAVVGVSAADNPMMAVEFLKAGASDFLKKPFLEEELLWRAQSALQMLDLVARVEAASRQDSLTGLSNRRSFFEEAEKAIAHAHAEDVLWLAILDVDHFKRVNDEHGHQAGDEVLKHTSALLNKHFGNALAICRFGGEEFCVLGKGSDAALALETFRREVQSSEVATPGGPVHFTISAGLYVSHPFGVQQMIKEADALLYRAKKNGRNCVVAGGLKA